MRMGVLVRDGVNKNSSQECETALTLSFCLFVLSLCAQMMAMAMTMMMLMAMTMMTNPRSSGSSREKAPKSENDCSLVFLNNLDKEIHVIFLRTIVIFVTLIVTKREIGRVATIIRMDPRVRNIAQIPGPSVHAVNELN